MALSTACPERLQSSAPLFETTRELFTLEDAMIRFTCECGKLLQGRDENAGQQVSCPSCGRRHIVPVASADAIHKGEDAFRPSAPADFGDELERGPARPPREDAAPVGTSGKATASLVLGVLSL